MSDFKFDFDTKKYTDFRRNLHRIPELAYHEFETEEFVKAFLENFPNFKKDMIVDSGIGTGFWVNVKGLGSPVHSKEFCVALRSDMDGLPILEENNFEYKSTNVGNAHACGHDGHMTVLTATLDLVLNKIAEIPNNLTVRFLYQPAEEGGIGASKMIDSHCLDGVDEIYGIHNFTSWALGTIGLKEGSVMASGNAYEININGQGGHGSTPHLCHSPITTGSEIVNKLNQITSQKVDSINRSIVSVGCFKSGSTGNVIPENAIIRGSFRTFSDVVDSQIQNEITSICNTICDLNSCTCKINYSNLGLSTDNNSDLVGYIKTALIGSIIKYTDQGLPVTGSEDFSYYQRKIPGAFMMLGCGDETHKEYIHTAKYDYNDLATVYGVELYLRIIQQRFNIQIFK